MSTESEKFEAIGTYLWKCTVDFWLIYSGKEKDGSDLKLHTGASSRFKSRDDCEAFAAKDHALATYCYQRKCDKIFEEILDPLNGTWTSIEIATGRVSRALREWALTPAPTNSIGQRWWGLVIASGATRDAGCVIVARVAAKDANEVRQYITDIQAIMENRDQTHLV